MNICMSVRTVPLRVKKLKPGAQIPTRGSQYAAGLDVYALIESGESITIPGGCRQWIHTGLAVSVPHGYEIQVRPRSGLACKKGVTVVNSPGTIDSDYRGEVVVVLQNTCFDLVEIKNGDRIAQLVVMPIPDVDIIEVDELDDTERGASGFGSSGR